MRLVVQWDICVIPWILAARIPCPSELHHLWSLSMDFVSTFVALCLPHFFLDYVDGMTMAEPLALATLIRLIPITSIDLTFYSVLSHL